MSDSTSPEVVLPPGFLFGTSTASYQIEGAVAEDGRGPSIWDTFSPARRDRRRRHRRRGLRPLPPVRRGRAADGRARRRRRTGSRSPGRGSSPPAPAPVNEAGLDFYDRLVDALLEAGIQPVATLFHWDLPQALEDAGGWLNRDTAARFADYAALVAGAPRRPGQPLDHAQRADRGHHERPRPGQHAPGQGLLLDAFPVAHHQLLGHGLAVPALRGRGRRARSAIAPTTRRCTPAERQPRPTGRPRSSTRCTTGSSPTRCCSARYPDGWAERDARAGRPTTWP